LPETWLAVKKESTTRSIPAARYRYLHHRAAGSRI